MTEVKVKGRVDDVDAVVVSLREYEAYQVMREAVSDVLGRLDEATDLLGDVITQIVKKRMTEEQLAKYEDGGGELPVEEVALSDRVKNYLNVLMIWNGQIFMPSAGILRDAVIAVNESVGDVE